MTLDTWFTLASEDARARGLDALVPALESLAKATAVLRAADWNDDASRPLGMALGGAPPTGPSSSQPSPLPSSRPPASTRHDA